MKRGRHLLIVAALVVVGGISLARAGATSMGGSGGGGGGGGLSQAAADLLYLALTGGTVTGTVTSNTGGGTNLAIAEGGFDKASGSTETFAFTNSGAGVSNITVDGSVTASDDVTATDDVISTDDMTCTDDLTVNGGAITLGIDTTVTLTGGVDGMNIDGALVVDGTNNRVGIGAATSPTVPLDVTGAIVGSSTLSLGGDLTFTHAGAADVTAATTQDLHLHGGSSAGGSVIMSSGDNTVDFMEDDGTTSRAQIRVSSSVGDVWFGSASGTNEGAIALDDTAGTYAGIADNTSTRNTQAFAIARNINTVNTGTSVYAFYAGGLRAPKQTTSAVCSSNAVTITPDSESVSLDANGAACAITMSESNAVDESYVTIVVTTSSGAGVVTIADSSGVQEGSNTACTTTGVNQWGSFNLVYKDDRWVVMGCSPG